MTVASPEKESCSEFEKTCPTVYAAGGGEFIRSAPAVIATVEDDDEELGSEDSD